MGIFKRAGDRVGTAVSHGLALDVLTSMFGFMRDLFYMIFMPWKLGAPGTPETFEEAMKRYGLTEQRLEERKKMFGKQVIIYLLTGMGVLVYAVFLARAQEYMGMFIAFLVAALAFAYAFRSHFWLFQLKQRRLGCTFKEWLSSSIQG
jgi:intracellular multiplication protein IcmV